MGLRGILALVLAFMCIAVLLGIFSDENKD